MKVKLNKRLWVMQHPDGKVYIETLATTQWKCWHTMCGGKNPGYIEDGYKPIPVTIEQYVVTKDNKYEH